MSDDGGCNVDCSADTGCSNDDTTTSASCDPGHSTHHSTHHESTDSSHHHHDSADVYNNSREDTALYDSEHLTHSTHHNVDVDTGAYDDAFVSSNSRGIFKKSHPYARSTTYRRNTSKGPECSCCAVAAITISCIVAVVLLIAINIH